MSLKSRSCNPQHVAGFADQSLSADELSCFERHLEDCVACRKAIREGSADVSVWENAGLFLRDDDGEISPLSKLSSASGEFDSDHSIASRVLESLAPTDDPHRLGRIDTYEVSGVVGAGGMGAVLKGYDPALNRVVAVKVMAPHLATSGAARKRFAREAQAAAAITHDNVIEIYAVAEANGLPYLVMPYARGPSLQKRVDDRGPLPLVEILRIGTQVASGLAAAHDQGLVHRDIKPGNILLNDGVDRLVITDFGLARAVDDASVTRTGVIAGTPQYMSPEQTRGEPIDHRSDLFSLGSVLYTLCTGRVPFRAETTFGILRRITDNEPRPIREINPEIPDWLCGVIQKLHAKHPSTRYQSAEEVAELLQHCLAHVQNPNTPLPTELRTMSRPWWKRSMPVTAAVAIVAAAFITGNAFLPESNQLPASDDTESRHREPEPGVTKIDDGHTQRIAAASDETQWNDGFDPSPEQVNIDAQQLDSKTQEIFAPGPGKAK